MAKSKMRSLKSAKGRKSKGSVKQLSNLRRKLRSMKRSEVKRRMKRSPRQAPLPNAAKRSPQNRNLSMLKKSKIKLIDANPGKKSKTGARAGTNVIFLATASARRSDLRKAKSPGCSPTKIGRLATRLLNYSKAREGVDFFCNLGQRILQSQPMDRQTRLRGGDRGLAKGMVGQRLMAGRLEAGGLGAERGIDLDAFSRRTELTRAMGLGSLCPGPVLNSTASFSAKDVVVPLTNRLPIIDFISTNEFNKIHIRPKSPGQYNRSFW